MILGESRLVQILMGGVALYGRPTGIGNYTRYLCSELSAMDAVADLKLLRNGRVADFGATHLADLSEASTKPIQSDAASSGSGKARALKWLAGRKTVIRAYLKFGAAFEKLSLSRYEKTHIFHSPNYVLPNFSGRRVVTIHDLSTLRYPEFHPPARVELVNAMIDRAVQSDAHIIVDSEIISRELQDIAGLTRERISVVPLGVPDDFEIPRVDPKQVVEKHGLEAGRFFLHVGTIEPRKNILRICEAFKLAKTSDNSLPIIVFVGDAGWKSELEHMAIAELVDRGLARYLEYVSHSDLVALYKSATALVFPSLYEGFGLPTAEAKSCGTRVITSAGTAMESLTDGADILVDPLATESIADGLVRSVVSGPEQGLAEPKIRRWRHVAEDTLGVYLKL